MEQIDEHEILVEYSEMTSFDFNSEEYQRVRKDYIQCKNFIHNLLWELSEFVNRVKLARN